MHDSDEVYVFRMDDMSCAVQQCSSKYVNAEGGMGWRWVEEPTYTSYFCIFGKAACELFVSEWMCDFFSAAQTAMVL